MINYKDVFQLAQDKGYKLHDNRPIPQALSEETKQKIILLELTLIQKWLRDEHKIFLEISQQQYYAPNKIVFSVNPAKLIAEQMRITTVSPKAETYEEALLNGINEALKLI